MNEWSNEIEAKLESADAEVERLQHWILNKERSDEIIPPEERFNLELKVHERKLKMQHELAMFKPNCKITETPYFKV